jgi:hypothetical protein
MRDFVAAQVTDLIYTGHHRHHFVRALYLGKNTLHSLEFGLMSVAVYLGNGIFDYDHAVILLNPWREAATWSHYLSPAL